MTASAVAHKYGFRSGLEQRIAQELTEAKVEWSFETMKLTYTVPASQHVYTPDFTVRTRTGKIILIETKGRFLLEDRRKHLLIREQYPEVDIRFVFSNANARLDKRSKTTCAGWAEKNGIPWANKSIPAEWLNE